MRPPQGAELTIEFPSRGTTYCNQMYGVYAYDTYPHNSVLAGMERRTFVDSFDTLLEAQVAYPSAKVVEGSCFIEPNLDFLPDEEDT